MTAAARARWATRLGMCAPFAVLPLPQREALVASATQRSLRRGEVLFACDQRYDAFAFVLAGRLEVVRPTDANALRLRSVGPNQVIGLSLAANAPASADVVAAERTTVLVVPGAPLRHAIARAPDLLLTALAHVSGLLADLTDVLEERRLPVRVRVARLLAREGDGLREVRLTHREIGDRVGASRAKVSHALEALARAQLIELGRGRIGVLDRPGLAALTS